MGHAPKGMAAAHGQLWFRGWVLVLAGGLFGLAGCADEVPGNPPPNGQLHFPTGLAVHTATGADPQFLYALNANFDQRFNAGSVLSFSVDRLFALVPTSSADDDVVFRADFGDAVVSQVRVFQFGGELISVPDGGGGTRLFFPSRGRNRLTMLQADARGQLDCGNRDEDNRSIEPVVALDCTEAHIIRTGFDDPLSLAYAAPADLLVVGHLRPEVVNTNVIGNVAMVPTLDFQQRVIQEREGSTLVNPVVSSSFLDLGGVTGLAYRSQTVTSSVAVGEVFVLGQRGGSNISGNAWFTRLELLPDGGGHRLAVVDSLLLTREADVIGSRGLVLNAAGTRAYASVRFEDIATSFNSGLMVINVEGPELRIVSVLELGEELGKPVFYPGGRLLYVPDIRTDRIWAVDASSDHLTVVAEITGRTDRTVDGKSFLARTLDGPVDIVFLQRGARTLGFVSNFANSTLGVIDASAPNPTQHRVVARFGRDLNPDGDAEGP